MGDEDGPLGTPAPHIATRKGHVLKLKEAAVEVQGWTMPIRGR